MKHCLYTVLGIALALSSCHTYYIPKEAETRNLRVQTAVSAVNTAQLHPLDELIAPYKLSLDKRMNTVIGQATERLAKEKPESALGNWMADAIQQQVNQLAIEPVDVSVQNYGGIRMPELNAGDITVGSIYELMPFDNMLVILDLSGLMTQRFFDHMAAGGGWPVSKEVNYVLQGKKATQLTINGEVVEPEGTYRVAMPDYIANGGGNCDFLRGLPQENTGKLIRDILIDEVMERTAAGQAISAEKDGRVRWGE